MPTISGGSNLDSVDMVVLPEAAAGSSGVPTADDGAPADDASVEAPAAESDNDDGVDDVPRPKFRKLICSEPPPAVRVSLNICCAAESFWLAGCWCGKAGRRRSWIQATVPLLPLPGRLA